MAIIFAMSSSLAAMSMVWCVGTDGHQGIEYKVAATVHATHQDAVRSGEPVGAAAHVHADDCRDWQILDKTKTAAAAADTGVLTFDLRTVVSLPALETLIAPRFADISRVERLQFAQTAPPDSQRLALRSVVLLI